LCLLPTLSVQLTLLPPNGKFSEIPREAEFFVPLLLLEYEGFPSRGPPLRVVKTSSIVRVATGSPTTFDFTFRLLLFTPDRFSVYLILLDGPPGLSSSSS